MVDAVGIRLASTARISALSHGSLQYYEWRIFVLAPEDTLDQIEFVTYFLHPTFPEPVQNVFDRPNAFALTAAGWGTFEVGALIHMKDGTTIPLTHELDFSAR